MTSDGEGITLHSISGKSVTLPFPTTYKAIFDAAVEPPFSFTPESVKIHTRGGIVNVQRYIKQHPHEKDGGVLDVSAYTSTATTASTGLTHVVSQVLSPSPGALPSTPGCRHGNFSRSLIVYGVPRRVKALPKGTAVEGVGMTSSSAVAAPAPSAHSTANASAPWEVLGDFTSALNASLPHSTAAVVAAALARSMSNRRPAKGDVTRSPLPYPHSPNGLRELAKIVQDTDLYEDEDNDLISLLQGAPQRLYNHPTMSYISYKVNGNLVTLRAVMDHIYQVAPAFYAWIDAYPQRFLSALNRVGERSLQQVKDQLHLLAMQAAAGQIRGDGPSRRVMMLEVNTRDGTPGVYQVEVQVGDFSDDDDDEDDSASASESLYYAGVEQLNEQDYEEEEGEEEEVDEEDADGEREKDASNTEVTVDGNNVGEGEENVDLDTAVKLQHASVVADGVEGEQDGGKYSTEGAEEADREPHRGAILLAPVDGAAAAERQTPDDALHSDHKGSAAVTVAPTTASYAPMPRASSATPAAPSGSSPARTRRPSLPPHRCSATAPSPASSSAVNASSRITSAGAASTAAEDVPATLQEDARLVELCEEVRAVDVLRHEYTRQGDDVAAQRTHHAIMLLRPRFFAVVGEVCKDICASSLSADEAGQYGALLRRVVQCACGFFSTAEEFYAQLDEEGVRASVFGPSPQESLAAWAAVAALSRLLMYDVEAAGQGAVVGAAAASVSGPRRIGALRPLHAANALWSHPALHWAFTRSPEELLASIMQLCRQQRAVVLWYSSHYLVKAVGKTVQTMSYVFGGREEVQQPVALQRLKMTSKAHKLDEVAECLGALSAASALSSNVGGGGAQDASAVSDSARRQWALLMRTRYQQLVRPIEADLPTPHMTANALYVCDTRHVLLPKETVDGRDRTAMNSAARWWAAYCDDRNTMCADKWCLAVTARPWNAAMASENAQDSSTAERIAVCLVSQTDHLESREESVSLLQGILPTEHVMTGGALLCSSSPFTTTARHTAVLHEQAIAPSEMSPASASVMRSQKSSAPGLSPHFIGDVHVVDLVPSNDADPSLQITTQWAGGAEVPTHLATVVRNYLLPTAAHCSVFLRKFFEMFTRHPQIPAAAAARQAALTNASANDAPWLVCEYTLMDYGGTIQSLASPAAAVVHAAHTTDESTESAGVVNGNYVRMPSVMLGRRLSEPRLVSVISRGRPSSSRNDEGRAVRGTASAAPTSTVDENVGKRQYARTHAIDELYEMMLGSLLEHQPTGERNVLDHLVSYLEVSEEAMQLKVQHRQAEMAAAAVGVPMEITTGAARPEGVPSPQPPSTKRSMNGRPALRRRKPSS